MAITKLGLQQVDDAYEGAKKHLKYAEEQLAKANQELAKMEKCHNCPHDDLIELDEVTHLETKCRKCGFTWADWTD